MGGGRGRVGKPSIMGAWESFDSRATVDGGSLRDSAEESILSAETTGIAVRLGGRFTFEMICGSNSKGSK